MLTKQHATAEDSKCHVVFLHYRLGKAPEDRYLIDLAIGLKKYGHEVTLVTSALDKNNCYEEVHPDSGTLNVRYSAWLLPETWVTLKAIVMGIRMCVFPPKPRPKVIILDTNAFILVILSQLTSYKTIFIKHFSASKELNHYPKFIRAAFDLITAISTHYANKFVVQSEDLAKVFKKSFPTCQKRLKYIYPCVDTGEWLKEGIDIRQFVPNMPVKCYLFVVFGPYKRRSNFKLAIDSFEKLLMTVERNLGKKLHLIIGGNCCEITPDEMINYDKLLDATKEKMFASRITFLKNVSVVQKKALLKKCTALLIPAKHDLLPNSILEAFAIGKPVIATNSGFAKTVVTDEISGILVNPDPYKFSAAMYKVLMNPLFKSHLSKTAADLYRNKFCFDVLARKIHSLVVKSC